MELTLLRNIALAGLDTSHQVLGQMREIPLHPNRVETEDLSEQTVKKHLIGLLRLSLQIGLEDIEHRCQVIFRLDQIGPLSRIGRKGVDNPAFDHKNDKSRHGVSAGAIVANVGELVDQGAKVGLGALVRVLRRVCDLAGDGVLAAVLDAVEKQEGVVEFLGSLSLVGAEGCRGAWVFQNCEMCVSARIGERLLSPYPSCEWNKSFVDSVVERGKEGEFKFGLCAKFKKWALVGSAPPMAQRLPHWSFLDAQSPRSWG